MPMQARPRPFLLASLSAALLISTPARSITIDSGDYAYAPNGTRLALAYFQHFEGRQLYGQGKKLADNARLSGETMLLRAVRYWDVGENYAFDPNILLPIGQVRTGGTLGSLESTNGIGDLILALPFHFIKDPTGRDCLAIAPYIWFPTGHYDRNNALNPFAENRWKLAIQAGRTYKYSEKISLELIGDVRFHGENNDFGPTGASLRQRPLWEVQTHIRYLFTPGTFVGAMLSHVEGGETRVNAIAQDDRQKLNKALLSVGHFITPDTQILASLGRDLSIRTGVKEDLRINFRIMKVF